LYVYKKVFLRLQENRSCLIDLNGLTLKSLLHHSLLFEIELVRLFI